MERRYDIDALRVLAFALLIVYHIAMVYVADWDFHFKSEHTWDWLQWPMLGVNRWRMPLIFLISGLALGFARPERSPLVFGLRRTLRLLLPLTFGMLLIVPIQAYCEAVSLGTVEPGFAAFMGRYLQLRPWPEAGFPGAEQGVTWNHLWYLAYLWVYTLVLLCFIPLLHPPIRIAKPGRTRRAQSSLWLLGPLLYLFACFYWVRPLYPITHALTDDWFSHLLYFPMLTFGYVVARSEPFWQWLATTRWPLSGLMLSALAAYMSLQKFAPPNGAWRASTDVAHALYLWSAVLTILAFAHRWLNRPFPWLPWATEAVYPWYILHQSLIVPLAFWLSGADLPLGLEALLVLTGTVAGCALCHEILIRRIPLLRPLFGLKYRQHRHRTEAGERASTRLNG